MQDIPSLFPTYCFSGLFLGLAPVLLGIRFLRKTPPWWVIFCAVILVGWAVWFLLVVSYQQYLWDLMIFQDYADQRVVDDATSDGGPLVMALFGGWLVSGAYAGAWWVVFLGAIAARRVIRGSRPKPD